jgi:hypothetical protein
MPHARAGQHRWILALAFSFLAQASTACVTPYRDLGAPGPADVTSTGSIGAPRLPGVAAWIAPYRASSSSTPIGGAGDGASIYGGLLMLGLGIPVTVLGIAGLASKRNLGDAIYVTTGGALLDAGGAYLLFSF